MFHKYEKNALHSAFLGTMQLPKPLYFNYISEFVGTALLLSLGLSFVIFDWGAGSVVARIIPSVQERRLITGFLFGCTGCAVTLSPVGKISGAHINPAVSIAFWLRRKMKLKVMMGYIISQMLGAIVGCLPLLFWGQQGKSVGYGNTLPGIAGQFGTFWGEAATTALLILVIYIFVGSPKLRNYTPYTMPFLYSVMVWAETAYSGCSTNPARSFGPAIVSMNFTGYWLYWAGPLTGVIIITVLFRALRLHKYYHIEAARVSHHNEPTDKNLKSV